MIEHQIGRYEIEAELGRGGMGIVYRAYEPVLHREVALKVLTPALAGQPGLLSRLRTEAVSSARLRHPNIVLLYEFVETPEQAYLVMEYAPGRSLCQVLEDGPLDRQAGLHILSQIGAALDYAHTIGVLHRDVKPKNIIVGPDNHAMLVDFGLADMTDNSFVTPSGVILGTPSYMSPEQAAGREATAESDQYSLAAVAYEILTGAPPFNYKNAGAIIHAHIYEIPAPPTESNPALPPQVNPVFARALSKAPADRYPGVMNFVRDLQAALAPPAPRRPVSWKTAATPWLLAAVVLLLGLLAGLTFLNRADLFGSLAAGSAADLPRQIAWQYDPGFVGGPELAPVGGRLVVGSPNGRLAVLNGSDGALLWSTDPNQVFYGYPAANADLVFVGNQLEQVEGLSMLTGGTVWSTRVTGKVQLAPLVFRQKLIAVTSKGYIYVFNAGNGRVIWSRPLVGGITALQATPDLILVSAESTLYALDSESGMIVWEFDTSSALTTRPVVVQDAVLVGTRQGVLHVLDQADGREQWRYQAGGVIQAEPAVDGERIYVADQSGALKAIDFTSRRVVWEYPAQDSLAAAPLLWAGFIYLGTRSGEVHILQATTGALVDTIGLTSSIETNPVQDGGIIFFRADRVYALKVARP